MKKTLVGTKAVDIERMIRSHKNLTEAGEGICYSPDGLDWHTTFAVFFIDCLSPKALLFLLEILVHYSVCISRGKMWLLVIIDFMLRLEPHFSCSIAQTWRKQNP